MSNLRDKRIFISYGHDDYFTLAERLAEDLKEYAADVWFDRQNIRAFNKNWAYEIERGIENCDIVLALMTKHAYRRPTGVCTNEIIYASNRKKSIRPILVENMEIPLLLCAIQYFDINDVYDPQTATVYENRYREKFDRLIEELENDQVDFKGYLHNVKAFLDPQNNTSELARRSGGFIGRRWLFDIYRGWLADSGSSIMFILGDPGSGKSSFLSKLTVEHPEVKGIHFCKYNDRKSGQVANIVKTVAYYLITQVEQYADYFGETDMQDLMKMSAEEVFDKLIVAPLSKIGGEHDPVVIAVDAVDEMPESERTLLVRLLTENKDRFPRWFRLVFTTRPNNLLTRQLEIFKPVVFDVGCSENLSDLRELIRLADTEGKLSEEQIAQIIRRSEGSIQYVSAVLEEFKIRGEIDVARLPNGMAGIFAKDFDRFFAAEGYGDAASLLEIMCAAKEPLTLEMCKEICGEKSAANALSLLGGYIFVSENKLYLFHKSLYDWLTDMSGNMKYYVSVKKGSERICAWVKENAFGWQENKYLCQHALYHFYELKDANGVAELLESRFGGVMDSFLQIMYVLTCNAAYPDRWMLMLLTKLASSQDLCEIVAGRAVKFFAEHGETEKIAEVLVRIFGKRCAWLQEFSEICQCRFKGEWRTIKEKGEAILPKLTNEELLLELYDYMGDAYRLIGDHANAFKYYGLAIEGVPQYERAERCFSSIYNFYDLRYVRGYLSEAEQAIRYYGEQAVNDDYKQYKTHRLLGNISFQKGDKEVALKHFEKTLECGKLTGRQYCIAEAMYSMAECLTGIDNERCLQLITESRNISQKISSKYNYAKTYFASVERLVAMRDWEGVLREGAEGVRILSEIGYVTGATRIKRNMAAAYYALGKYRECIDFAMHPLTRYKERSSYPIARLKSYLLILEAAKKLNVLDEYIDADRVDEIQNLSEFPNSGEIVAKIRSIVGEKG